MPDTPKRPIRVTAEARELIAKNTQGTMTVRSELQREIELLELPSDYSDFYKEIEAIAEFLRLIASGKKRIISPEEVESLLSLPYCSPTYENGVTPRFQKFVARVNTDIATRLSTMDPNDPRRVSFKKALRTNPLSDPNWLASHDLRRHLHNVNLAVDCVRTALEITSVNEQDMVRAHRF